MNAPAASQPLRPAHPGEWGLPIKIMIFLLLVGLLGLLQLWLQLGMAHWDSKPPMNITGVVSDGSVFFYSLALYFATLYSVLMFSDLRMIKEILLLSFLIGLFLLIPAVFLEGINFHHYFGEPDSSGLHHYQFTGDWFLELQAGFAAVSLLYAAICTFKLERASDVEPAVSSDPREHTS